MKNIEMISKYENNECELLKIEKTIKMIEKPRKDDVSFKCLSIGLMIQFSMLLILGFIVHFLNEKDAITLTLFLIVLSGFIGMCFEQTNCIKKKYKLSDWGADYIHISGVFLIGSFITPCFATLIMYKNIFNWLSENKGQDLKSLKQREKLLNEENIKFLDKMKEDKELLVFIQNNPNKYKLKEKLNESLKKDYELNDMIKFHISNGLNNKLKITNL